MNKAINAIKKLTQPVAQRAALAVARCVLRLVNDALPLQTAQIDVLSGETRDKVERVQEYGFTSVPLPGCRGIAVFIGGDRASGAIVATDDSNYRPKGLNAGEVEIYTNNGDFVHLKQSRETEMNSLTLVINAPNGVTVNAAGGVTVNAPSVAVPSGDVIASGISLAHHTHAGCQGGSTGMPQ